MQKEHQQWQQHTLWMSPSAACLAIIGVVANINVEKRPNANWKTMVPSPSAPKWAVPRCHDTMPNSIKACIGSIIKATSAGKNKSHISLSYGFDSLMLGCRNRFPVRL